MTRYPDLLLFGVIAVLLVATAMALSASFATAGTGVASLGEYGEAATYLNNVKLEEGGNVTLTTSDAHNSLIISAGTGPIGPAGGDLAGMYPDPTVDGIQGRAITSTAPSDGQLYTWDSGDSIWLPSNPANIFGTINAPSGTDPVADSITDTLNLAVSGSDVSVTGDAGTDTLTWDLLTDVGTDITADLEEESHASEHASGGDDALYVYREGIWQQAGDVDAIMEVENLRLYARTTSTIVDAFCSVNTAPTTDAVIVDFNKNGTTIFTTQGNRVQIAATEFYDLSGIPDVTSYNMNDYFTIEIDQADAGDTATDLSCQLRVKEAVIE